MLSNEKVPFFLIDHVIIRPGHVTVYLYGEFFFRIIDLVLQRGNRYELSFLRRPKKSIPKIYYY
jgi:hypothetical protein